VAILGDLVDAYLLYASVALAAMGVIALALAFVFRRRFRRLTAVSGGSEATVFHRSFIVFDPYEKKKTIFHRFLPLMMTVPIIGCMVLAMMLFFAMGSGLLLALLVVVVGLSLMTVGESVESYSESKLLINAIENGSNLGVGDVRLLNFMKTLLPRLIYYYVALAVLMFVSATAFPIVWSNILPYSAQLFGFVLQVSGVLGVAGWFVCLILYGSIIATLYVVATSVKNRLFGFHIGSLGNEQTKSFRGWLVRARTRTTDSSDEQGKTK
jgi:hypothetical protein